MKRFIFCFVAFLCFTACKNQSIDDPVVRSLAKRIIPADESMFKFEVVSADTMDCFELSSDDNFIIIKGNNSNSIAVGLNYYLQHYCLTSVSWMKCNDVVMPEVLPRINKPIRVSAKVDERFFLNYCTFGYTMPWWKWSEWERFIDWMALHGVTMPLAITGQEAIWQKVWSKFGLSDDEIRNYFTGPAHLPWHRMSNIDYWEGPLPQSWIDNQLALQKKIVARERELGMKPILPAFAGHIPQEIKRIFPNAHITRVSFWGGFADEYRCSFLDPMDSLFSVIQRAFLEEQTKEFGTDHIYGADPFNEIDAPSWDPTTLSAMSKNLYKSISDVDSSAIWLQMGWLFYADPVHWTPENIKGFLRAVPQDRLLMLDYFCEFTEIWKTTEKFYEQPYIWCYLGNFGGNTMTMGNFRTVSERLNDAFANGGNNLKGLGSTLEGFGVNEFMYEYVLDRAWANNISDDDWIDALADRHVGFHNDAARKAWHLLCDEIYVSPAQTGQATLTNAHPALEGNWHWTTKPASGYNCRQLLPIWKLLLSVDSDRPLFRFDVVNVGRQFLGDYFLELRNDFTASYKKMNIDSMDFYAAKMMDVLNDIETLVACHPEFSLEEWLNEARSFGNDEKSKSYYEKNARTLISIWGDSYVLTDYANRTWNGMVSSYYAPRWQMFLNQVRLDASSKHAFNQKLFDEGIRKFECEWVDKALPIHYKQELDALEVARSLYSKYVSDFD